MNARRRWAAVALTAALACASRRGWREPAPASTPPEEIRRVALVIEHDHVTPVEAASLLRVAAGALDAEAGGGPATEAADPGAALDAALARLRTAHPETTDVRAIGIAVHAMARSLGDASRYVGPEEVRRNYLLPGSAPEVRAAVGLVLEKGDPYPSILRIIPGSPAAAGGVEAGSELRSVDGRATGGMPLGEVTGLLAGPPGSEVRLALGAPGGPERVLAVRRAAVDAGAVDCRILGGRVLYLRTRQLTASTASQVRGFARAHGEQARLVVLDLRGNQGGLLEATVDLADEFLASGTILSVRYRDPRRVTNATARPGTSPLESARVVVLVDGDTSSGAEAVAAAILDNRRGPVMGARTAGKASIDVLVRTTGGGFLRLAVGRLFRAGGQPIDGQGVSPNVAVDPAEAPSQVPSDVACPGFASPAPVAREAPVARAAAYLLGP